MSNPDQIPTSASSSEEDPLALQAQLKELQAKQVETPLTLEETRLAIQLIRKLRRTNTGPAQKKVKAKKGTPIQLDSLLG